MKKIVIEIAEDDYNRINSYSDGKTFYPITARLYKAVKDGTPIPNNATNGDVIKAMFPNVDFTEMAFTVHATTSVTSNGVKGGISYDFWKDWWNAPYQEGGKK